MGSGDMCGMMSALTGVGAAAVTRCALTAAYTSVHCTGQVDQPRALSKQLPDCAVTRSPAGNWHDMVIWLLPVALQAASRAGGLTGCVTFLNRKKSMRTALSSSIGGRKIWKNRKVGCMPSHTVSALL
jgi:hypothetical protein